MGVLFINYHSYKGELTSENVMKSLAYDNNKCCDNFNRIVS